MTNDDSGASALPKANGTPRAKPISAPPGRVASPPPLVAASKAAERQQRYRARRRAGKLSVRHDVDISVVEDLVAKGALRANQCDDANAVGRALERVEVIIVRVTT